jgi:D-tagatose-bisphosphate aldolase class II non-catalytic subunit
MNAHETFAAMIAGNRAGEARGLPSWCAAHPRTLRAILRAHRDGDDPILIEATCNQVNQFGGYSGLTPAGFRALVEGLAREAGVDFRRIILGGDHLGPNPWKDRPAAEAMAMASDMVRAYVAAGYDKIHLDASMACADDRDLTEAAMAARAAQLCAAAESASGGRPIVFVIGTEVPIPGGETETPDALAVTRREAALRTFALHRAAFADHGVSEAIDRVIALVVQPGVDFGNSRVFGYDKAAAADLSAAVLDIPGVVFEAHSTDYQTQDALRQLVESHFAILKVGPELTFAFREAVFAMAAIEERIGANAPSNILSAIAAAMDENPRHWRGYIADNEDLGLARLYGLSDRIRYYWPDARIEAALQKLAANIDAAPVPPGIVSQFVGRFPPGDFGPSLADWIIHAKVGDIVAKYRAAANHSRVIASESRTNAPRSL